MLQALHTVVRRTIYELGKIDPEEVGISFEQPTRQWADALTKPTINCFLYDIEEFAELRNTTMQASTSNGRVVQRLPARRFNLRYHVSAWSSEIADEHTLIWRTLAVFSRYNPLPAELLPAELQHAPTLHARVGRYDTAPTVTDLWGGLGLPPKPALIYTLTAPLDLDIALEAPMVLSTSTRVRRNSPENERSQLPVNPKTAILDRVSTRVGGTIRDAAGRPVAGVVVALQGSAEEVRTDNHGRYILTIRRPGPITLAVSQPDAPPRLITIEHDSASYDIDLD